MDMRDWTLSQLQGGNVLEHALPPSPIYIYTPPSPLPPRSPLSRLLKGHQSCALAEVKTPEMCSVFDADCCCRGMHGAVITCIPKVLTHALIQQI